MTTDSTTVVAREGAGSIGPLATAAVGLVAGVAMGALLHFQLYILYLFGALWGQPTLEGGLLLHGVASVAFAGVFVRALGRPPVARYAAGLSRLLGLGALYGVVLWVVVGGVVLPLLTMVTPPATLDIPYLPVDSLVAHLVYGLLLGGGVAVAGAE